ncbi:hypothetical protein BDV93DRAFT_556892 [Ceratobasidium sp. AG-I]|nr:hypothetical protein BDV93DRAFT_556892 [Ceratobasidium sp. AG-I]
MAEDWVEPPPSSEHHRIKAEERIPSQRKKGWKTGRVIDRFRSTSHRRRSPSPHPPGLLAVNSELIPPEQASLALASFDRTTSTHSTILARSLAHLDITSDPDTSTAAGTASQPDAPVGSAARTRAPGLAPIDTIRRHLQGHAWRRGKARLTSGCTIFERSLPQREPNYIRRPDKRDAVCSILDSGSSDTSHDPAPVLYRPPTGSTQRASPGSSHSPTTVRDRLLESLEAAKAANATRNPPASASPHS